MVKYFANCFFSVKVSFVNEMYQICEKLGLSYNDIMGMVMADGRIGNSHWSVPGHDGSLGFGGKCFPKDLTALIHKAQELGVDPKVMRAAWRKNLEVRGDKDWLQIPGASSED